MVRAIRANVITLITPCSKSTAATAWSIRCATQATPGAVLPPLMYWGHYVAHDNNRDAMGMGLKLTRNVLGAYFDWHPQVVHDFHESIPFLYVSTGTGPYNPALDPIAIDEWQRMAYHETQTLTEKGLVGVWTHGFYDGWAPNYMFWIAHGHNSIGRFYETFGNLVPTTEDRVVRGASQRDWYRPNPPYPKVRWALRNNTNYQQSGALLALKYFADNREHVLRTFWTLGKRSLAKATTEGPAAYAFPGDQKRLGQLRDLLNLLRDMGIEVQRTDQAVTVEPGWPPKKKDKDKEVATEAKADKKADGKDAKKDEKKETTAVTLPSGSFVIRMDQPYSRLADTLLDTQYVLAQERVYDDTGWTLGLTKNVDVKRIVNGDVLRVPMHPWDGSLVQKAVAGKVLAIRNHADTDLVRLRFAAPQARFAVLEEENKSAARTLAAGTVIVDATDAVRAAMDKLGSFDVLTLDAWPQGKLHDIPPPRIALLHTWLDTQDEGWFRLAFENLKVPYDYISTQKIGTLGDLRSRYDVIVFPPAGGEPSDIVNGLPPGPPIPWKKTALTPNLGVDETDDMRPRPGPRRCRESAALRRGRRPADRGAGFSGLGGAVRPRPVRHHRAERQAPLSRLRPAGEGERCQEPGRLRLRRKGAGALRGSPIFRVGEAPRRDNDRRPSGRFEERS